MILDEDLVRKRRKISEIFERRVLNRRERNEYGEWEYVEKEFLFRIPVNSVSGGFRLIHYIVDYLVIQTLFSVSTIFLAPYFPQLLIAFAPLFVFFAHNVLGEFYLQKTAGKFLTGAIVVDEYGDPPELRTILLRTAIRLIPFDVFSFWGERGWHDRWSGTYVIRRSELERLKRLIREGEDVEIRTDAVI